MPRARNGLWIGQAGLGGREHMRLQSTDGCEHMVLLWTENSCGP